MFEKAHLVSVDQAINVATGGSLEPGIQSANCFYRPTKAAFGWIHLVTLNQAQGFVNEAVLHLPKDGLVVGESHIRVGVVNNVDGIKGMDRSHDEMRLRATVGT